MIYTCLTNGSNILPNAKLAIYFELTKLYNRQVSPSIVELDILPKN